MKPQTKMSKQERAAKRMEEAIRQKYWKRTIWAASLIIIIGGILGFSFFNQEELPGKKVEIMDDQSHIPEVTSPHTPYSSDPPTSGPHVENIAPWGIHREPLPKELLVHNLEDGGVVIYYNSEVDQNTVKQLEQIVSRYTESVVLNPYPDIDSAITLTAWGRMDQLQQMDEKRVTDFIETFKGIDHHQ